MFPLSTSRPAAAAASSSQVAAPSPTTLLLTPLAWFSRRRHRRGGISGVIPIHPKVVPPRSLARRAVVVVGRLDDFGLVYTDGSHAIIKHKFLLLAA